MQSQSKAGQVQSSRNWLLLKDSIIQQADANRIESTAATAPAHAPSTGFAHAPSTAFAHAAFAVPASHAEKQKQPGGGPSFKDRTAAEMKQIVRAEEVFHQAENKKVCNSRHIMCATVDIKQLEALLYRINCASL